MKRREFLGVLGAAVAACSRDGFSQVAAKPLRLGMVSQNPDPHHLPWLSSGGFVALAMWRVKAFSLNSLIREARLVVLRKA